MIFSLRGATKTFPILRTIGQLRWWPNGSLIICVRYIYIFLIDIYFHILRKNRYFTYNAQFIKLGDYSKRKGNKKFGMVKDYKRCLRSLKK